MGRKRKPRGSLGVHSATFADPSHREAYDLMIPLPKDVSSKVQSQLLVRNIMERLASVGFTHMALTHTIYGRPRPAVDAAEIAIPKSLWTTTTTTTKSENDSSTDQPTKKKQKTQQSSSTTDSTTTTTTTPPIRVLRRLHAVLENLSDVSVFLSNSPFASLLDEYDIVSISPRNEATFQSVCASASMADIITLDYHTTRGMRLPYRIRSADVQAATLRKTAFEIPYAPALLQNKQRKALIQACHELQSATTTSSPLLLLFSSGDRMFEESDIGTLALRMPGDLINLMQAVLRFDPTTSSNAIKRTGGIVIKRSEDRRWGESDVVDIQMETKASLLLLQSARRLEKKDAKLKELQNAEGQDEDEEDSTTKLQLEDQDAENMEEGGDHIVEDGFIAM